MQTCPSTVESGRTLLFVSTRDLASWHCQILCPEGFANALFSPFPVLVVMATITRVAQTKVYKMKQMVSKKLDTRQVAMMRPSNGWLICETRRQEL